MSFLPYIGPDQNIIIPELLSHGKALGGENSVDPTNFVTYFPAYFKNVIRDKF